MRLGLFLSSALFSLNLSATDELSNKDSCKKMLAAMNEIEKSPEMKLTQRTFESNARDVAAKGDALAKELVSSWDSLKKDEVLQVDFHFDNESDVSMTDPPGFARYTEGISSKTMDRVLANEGVFTEISATSNDAPKNTLLKLGDPTPKDSKKHVVLSMYLISKEDIERFQYAMNREYIAHYSAFIYPARSIVRKVKSSSIIEDSKSKVSEAEEAYRAEKAKYSEEEIKRIESSGKLPPWDEAAIKTSLKASFHRQLEQRFEKRKAEDR